MTAEHVVNDHLDAVNGRDLEALLDGLTEDAVWVTGTAIVRGRAELATFFAAALEGLLPRLEVRALVADAERVACELTETITVDGTERRYPIAAFYRVRDGRIAEVRVYREGSAEVL